MHPKEKTMKDRGILMAGDNPDGELPPKIGNPQ
jgi:hypothetical protein